MPRMAAEGTILKDTDGFIISVKNEAQRLLDAGPEGWPKDTVDIKRYFITDALEDFLGSSYRAEDLFIAGTLAELISEFYLRTNGQWIGASKWVVRALKRFNGEFADNFVEAFDSFYRTGDKSKIVSLADEVLHPYGGRLFAGFSIGKDQAYSRNC
ncbi:nucleotidyltransferase [Sediminibacillus albus]|uniref:nucleotidyltransferase n=1 Tax=Sediminibacillus albus TaxID=407036 RepID=UPI00267F82E0